MRVCLYCRISDDDGRRLGVIRQERDGREFVKKRKWSLVDVFIDNDTSAFSGKVRPGYQAMMEGLKEGRYDVIVAWHPDRLHRHPRELEDFIDALDAAHATVATVTAGDYDLSTPDGRLVARIIGSVARKESEDKSRRLRRKHLELAENGQVATRGGPRPFGYRPDFTTIEPAEALLLRQAAKRLLVGDSLWSIVSDWNARGVATVTGKPWTVQVLRQVLVSPRVAGLRAHKGVVKSKAAWRPILKRDVWERVVAVLTDPSRSHAKPRRYLLTGMLFCTCGAKMVAQPQHGHRGYACTKEHGGCGHVYARAEPLESYVAGLVMGSPRPRRLAREIAAQSNRGETIAEQLHAAEAKLLDVGRSWEADEITKPEWMARRVSIVATIDGLRAKLATESVDPLAGITDLKASWEGLGLHRQRAVVDHYLEHVTLSPAPDHRGSFNKDRVKTKRR